MSFLNVNVDGGKHEHHREYCADKHHLLSNAGFFYFVDAALVHQIPAAYRTVKVKLYFTAKNDW